MSEHQVIHVEISARDRLASSQFYENVFGWGFEQMPEMNYANHDDEHSSIGLNPITEHNPAGTVMVYISADDIEGTLAKIEANGGKVLQPKMEIPTVGWFAAFSDPAGNVLSLFKGIPRSQG